MLEEDLDKLGFFFFLWVFSFLSLVVLLGFEQELLELLELELEVVLSFHWSLFFVLTLLLVSVSSCSNVC